MVLVDAKDNIAAGYSQKTKAHVNMALNDNHKLQIRMGWLTIVLQIHKFHLVRLLDVKYIGSGQQAISTSIDGAIIVWDMRQVRGSKPLQKVN